jgi:TRAP-type C4-dicarboxylate transport system permease small subunit
MQYALITLACSLMLITILGIVTTSYAMDCYSNRKDSTEFKYFIVNLVIAILFLLVSFSSMYLAFNDKFIDGSMPTIKSRH